MAFADRPVGLLRRLLPFTPFWREPNMTELIREPARDLPVSGTYDVGVVGGGIAGVAAALAAARNGARTALIERGFGLGGLATLGNVVIYEPLCDGRGRQVIGGLGEELLRRSVHDLRIPDISFNPAPACWTGPGERAERSRHRYVASFNPFSFQIEMEAMIAEAGVDLWYDTRLCACLRDGPRISHLVVENKDGRSAMTCAAVVDASGDADVCALAGEATETLESNVLAGWHYLIQDGKTKLQALSKNFAVDGGTDGSEGPFFSGVRARDVTAHTVQTRALIRERVRANRAQHPEAEIHPFALPSLPSFRMTRRLVSSFTLLAEHAHTWFDDAIGLTGDWRHAGPVWALPYRAIRADRNRNLLTAGRCISSAGRAWEMSRVIPTCAVTGEAAGTAAALAARLHQGDAHTLSVAALQAQLRSQRVILDQSLV
ncbi:MAG: FAD-dependent oxidoreductase [Planctomycetes bacterium]|nr:FAD-dependent oxidoreductase [Planctomycetota bacterium]